MTPCAPLWLLAMLGLAVLLLLGVCAVLWGSCVTLGKEVQWLRYVNTALVERHVAGNGVPHGKEDRV